MEPDLQAYLTQDMREADLANHHFDHMVQLLFKHHRSDMRFQWRIRIADFESYLLREAPTRSWSQVSALHGFPIVWLRGEYPYVASLESADVAIGLLDSGEFEWKESEYVS